MDKETDMNVMHTQIYADADFAHHTFICYCLSVESTIQKQFPNAIDAAYKLYDDVYLNKLSSEPKKAIGMLHNVFHFHSVYSFSTTETHLMITSKDNNYVWNGVEWGKYNG